MIKFEINQKNNKINKNKIQFKFNYFYSLQGKVTKIIIINNNNNKLFKFLFYFISFCIFLSLFKFSHFLIANTSKLSI